MSYLIHLPLPPLLNNYYGLACNGRMPRKYIKQAGKDYRTTVKEVLQAQDLVLRANIPLFVTLTLTPTNKGLDIDSTLKCLFDSLTEADFWLDDSFVRKLLVDYDQPTKEGSLLLHVEAL